MSQSNKILLEDAYNNYKMLHDAYNDTYSKYMVRYDGDEELVRSLLYPLELKENDAELKFYDMYFSLPDCKLDLMRYLYDHVLTKYGLTSGKEENNH